jgi:hypothetical protein
MSTLDRLKELEAKATPGPWKSGSYDGRGVIHGPSTEHPVCPISDVDFEVIGDDEELGEYGYIHDVRPPFRKRVDSELCAEMRNALPKLLAVFEAGNELARTFPEAIAVLQREGYKDTVVEFKAVWSKYIKAKAELEEPK